MLTLRVKHLISPLLKQGALRRSLVKKVEEATGLSREAANRLVKRFCKEGILLQKDQNVKYGRLFVYKDYLSLFE